MEKSTEVQKAPVKKSVANRLQDYAAKDKVFSAVCHVFALRERARSQVTLARLKFVMKREGYDYSKEDLSPALEFLAGLGIGRVEKTRKGKVAALKDIQYTLQSVGKTAISKDDSLARFTPATVYKEIPAAAAPAPPPSSAIREHLGAGATSAGLPAAVYPVARKPVAYPAVLTVTVDGKPAVFEVPAGITIERLSKILAEMYQK